MGEIGSTDELPVTPASRRTSFCSAHNSGEDFASTTVSSGVDERQRIGRFTFLQPWHKREATSVSAIIYHSETVNSMF